jgi:hypothetical protein
MTEVLGGFTQPLQAKSRVVSKSGHDHFQISTNLSSIHLALYKPAIETADKQPKVNNEINRHATQVRYCHDLRVCVIVDGVWIGE